MHGPSAFPTGPVNSSQPFSFIRNSVVRNFAFTIRRAVSSFFFLSSDLFERVFVAEDLDKNLLYLYAHEYNKL